MSELPIKSILWAPTNTAHNNHLHVEGDPRFTGTPPANNPGMSDSVWTIYVALAERFGEPAYFQDKRSSTDWTHMGWYNRRPIAGTSTWSQHSWSNALDIGPYYGVAQQQKFYDFLTGKEDAMAHKHNPMPSDLPRSWADGVWEEWVVRSDTDGATRTFDFYREDLAWVYSRVIQPLEKKVAALEARVKTLEQGGGSTGTHNHDGRYVKNITVSK